MGQTTIKIIVLVLFIGLGIWGFLSYRKDDETENNNPNAQLGFWKEGQCVKRSTKRNFSRWKVDGAGKDIPSSGNHGKIAEKYFGGEPGMAGKVGGFFKGIDTIASLDAARFYKKEMIAWVNSNQAYDWWQMSKGELLCTPNIDLSNIDLSGIDLSNIGNYGT